MAHGRPDLADFYRSVFGWQIEQIPRVDYWRIQPGSTDTRSLHGGLTYRVETTGPLTLASTFASRKFLRC
jgi:predicted enzyme related to lactoylglutathione lyase